MFAFLYGLARRQAIVLLVTAFLSIDRVLAGEEPASLQDMASQEIWSGAETFARVWALYTGSTFAPDGVTRTGIRLRFVAGRSSFSGETRAEQAFADLLVGYQWQVGTLTLKAFAGVGGRFEAIVDEGGMFRPRAEPSAKGVVEGWWTIDERTWMSADLALALPHAVAWSRVRVARRVLPVLSIGPEVGIAGDDSRLGGRLGAFARYEWDGGEISVSGGMARDAIVGTGALSSTTPEAGAYATLTWLQRY